MFIFVALRVFSFYTCHNWFAFASSFLTGSERVKETKSVGGTFTESQNINKSLLTLGEFVMTWFHILPADGFSAKSDEKNQLFYCGFNISTIRSTLVNMDLC